MPALIKYNPWSLLRDIQDDVNQIFERNTGQWSPRVDVTEFKDKYCVIADLPGVDPKDIKVSLEGNTLSIQGERKTEERKEDHGYTRLERFAGSFHRQFTLPNNINPSKIEANSKHGVLELTIPKKEPNQPQKIDIKIEPGK